MIGGVLLFQRIELHKGVGGRGFIRRIAGFQVSGKYRELTTALSLLQKTEDGRRNTNTEYGIWDWVYYYHLVR